MKHLSCIGLGVAAALVLSAGAGAQEIPVRRVVLYKNGVGYVERGGEASASGPVTLTFRADEMTDVLKSLSVSATNGSVERVRVAGGFDRGTLVELLDVLEARR